MAANGINLDSLQESQDLQENDFLIVGNLKNKKTTKIKRNKAGLLESPANPQDGDTLVYNSTSGEWEAGSAGGGVQNGYELLTEFDYQMFNSNVDEPSFLISNIPLPSVSHFIQEAVLVEVSPLDVDSISRVSIINPVTTNLLFTVSIIDKLTLFTAQGGGQESTVNVEVQGPDRDLIAGGNTQGEYKIFVKYGQIPN